ncbi:MAG: hypothetical protein GX591_11605 [Planctomycetes bacterium]|nr:hypothetical protein [Planctomycetota bacterium]
MITFTCSECGQTMEVEDGRAGGRAACPRCRFVMRVPDATAEAGVGPLSYAVPDREAYAGGASRVVGQLERAASGTWVLVALSILFFLMGLFSRWPALVILGVVGFFVDTYLAALLRALAELVRQNDRIETALGRLAAGERRGGE